MLTCWSAGERRVDELSPRALKIGTQKTRHEEVVHRVSHPALVYPTLLLPQKYTHSTSAVPAAMPAMARAGNSSKSSTSDKSPRNTDAGQDDLVSSMGRLSMRPPPAVIKVPPISAYASGKPAIALAGKAVVVGEAIARAEPIPDNFSSTAEYLKVN